METHKANIEALKAAQVAGGYAGSQMYACYRSGIDVRGLLIALAFVRGKTFGSCERKLHPRTLFITSKYWNQQQAIKFAGEELGFIKATDEDKRFKDWVAAAKQI